MSLNARDFTQGGQVTKYMIGMFMQIMNIASYWVILFSACIFILWMCIRLSLQAFIHGSAYWLIKWTVIPLNKMSGADGYGWNFSYERASGEVVRFHHTASQVMNDPYFIHAAEQVKDAAFYGWGISTFSFVLMILGITWFFGNKGKKQREDEVTGGRVMADSYKDLNRLLKKAGKMSPISICGLHILQDSEMQNFGLHGTVGSGKSTALNDLMRQLRERGDRVIVYDKGNNFIPLFYRQDKDLLLNPFDARCAPWDLWEECLTIADFENFATSLLPDSQGGSDPFWVLSARALFVATARRMAREKDRSIAGLLKKLMSISLAELREYLKDTDGANLVDGSIEKTAMTVRTILTTYARSLRYLQGLDEQGRHPFNIRDWMHTEDAGGDNPWIFISSDGQNHNSLKPLLTAWLYMCMTGILSLTASRDRRVWLFLDELPSLHKLPILPEFLAEARKFGGCSVVAVQNFPQLKEQFGTNFAESIWDLLNTRMFYRAPSGTVAEWVQREIGEKQHKKFRDQYSYGVDIIRDGVQFSKDETNEFLVSYSDVQSLDDLECYITLPGSWPAVRMRLTRQSYREIATGRIDRPVDDLFDAELEEGINAGENDIASRIVGRLFGDAGVTDSTPPPDADPASEDATSDGRTASLTPATPSAGDVSQEAEVYPDEANPDKPAQELAVDDVRHHDSNPELNMRV